MICRMLVAIEEKSRQKSAAHMSQEAEGDHPALAFLREKEMCGLVNSSKRLVNCQHGSEADTMATGLNVPNS